MRRTRLRSALATGRSWEKERRTRFDFLRRRWLRRCFRRRSFPLPVILKRFAVALCVFILGIVLNTSSKIPTSCRFVASRPSDCLWVLINYSSIYLTFVHIPL
jgi:hypothetical protein